MPFKTLMQCCKIAVWCLNKNFL